MPELKTSGRKKYVLPLGILYVLLSCIYLFTALNYQSPNYSELFQIVCSLGITVLFFSLLVSLGDTASTAIFAVLVPIIASWIISFTLHGTGDMLITNLLALSGIICSTLTAVIIYYSGYRKGSVANACSTASFMMLVFSVLEVFILLLIKAMVDSKSIHTVLFDSISYYISEYSRVYLELLASSPIYSSSAIDTATLSATLEDSLTLIIALLPAILCAAYFFVVFVITRICGRFTKAIGLTEVYPFEKFMVSGLINAVFTVAGIIVLFSLLFESAISSFTCGIISVIITLLPNYLILGIRRIMGKLRRIFSVLFTAVILIVIFLAGMAISPFLLIVVITYFGISEYRHTKFDRH